MASRAEQKAKARADRIEYERKLAEDAKRKQRISRLAGVVIAAVVIIVAAIVISSGGSSTAPPTNVNSPSAIAAQHRVNSLLAGIPESGNNTLGNPSAPVQITEYGDLECSACDAFALPTNINTSNGTPGSGIENQLIDNAVKTGKASLVYRALETATGTGATPNEFVPQQVAALAAGLQGKAWNYIELFYNEQGAEGSSYVNQTFLDRIAKQIPGLNYQKWLSDLNNPALAAQVTADKNAAQAGGYGSTPTIVIKGPKGQAPAISGVPSSYAEIQSAINKVS